MPHCNSSKSFLTSQALISLRRALAYLLASLHYHTVPTQCITSPDKVTTLQGQVLFPTALRLNSIHKMWLATWCYGSFRTAHWSEPNFRCWGFLGDSDGKESACNTGDVDLIPGSGRFPWRREWLPTPVFLLGEFHRQRSLADYSPWSRKELDMTD